MKRIILILFTITIITQLIGCTNKESHANLIRNNSYENAEKEKPTVTEDEKSSTKNEDWIYFINEKDKFKLYKKQSDESNITKIYDDERVTSLSVSNGWIFYTIFDGVYQLYKIKTDGTSKEKICDLEFLGDPVEQEISSKIDSDWIIFEIMPYQQAALTDEDKKKEEARVKEGMHSYKVSLDGKEYELLK